LAQIGLAITDKVVIEELGGKLDLEKNEWIIPLRDLK